MLDAPSDPSAKLWFRLWRDWLAPNWGLLAVSLAMTAVVAVASAGYSKLIQLVMTAFQSHSETVLWWGPLGVIVLSGANAVGQYYREVTSNEVTNRMETELRKDDVRQARRQRPRPPAVRGAGRPRRALLLRHRADRHRRPLDARRPHRGADHRRHLRRPPRHRLDS